VSAGAFSLAFMSGDGFEVLAGCVAGSFGMAECQFSVLEVASGEDLGGCHGSQRHGLDADEA
jgi:hypothetical protein